MHLLLWVVNNAFTGISMVQWFTYWCGCGLMNELLVWAWFSDLLTDVCDAYEEAEASVAIQ